MPVIIKVGDRRTVIDGITGFEPSPDDPTKTRVFFTNGDGGGELLISRTPAQTETFLTNNGFTIYDLT